MHPALRHYYYYSAGEALPDYESLSNLELYVDYSGLAVGTTNDYGVVDGSGNVTTLKSLAPGPTGRDFTNVGTAPTLTADGVLNSTGVLRAGVASKTWANFLHYNATIGNLKHTVRAVVKFGSLANPNALYGLLGNNAGASANKGFSAFFDDRTASSRNNGFATFMSAAGGIVILNSFQNETVTPNEFVVVRIETRFDLTNNEFRHALFVNNILQGVATTSASTSVVTTPTYDLEIFGIGNAGGAAVATLKELTIQSGIDDGLTAWTFDRALMNKHGITAATTTPTVDITRTTSVYNTISTAGQYYLCGNISQHPSKPYKSILAYIEGSEHVPDGAKKAVIHLSTNYSKTIGSAVTIYDPVGNINPASIACGYNSSGRYFAFLDVRTINSPPWFLRLIYTDNDFTSQTEVDLTSLIPDDTLDAWGVDGKVIVNNGVLMVHVYKADTVDSTITANYLFQIDENADPSVLANWSVRTIKAVSTTKVNEGDIEVLTGNNLIFVGRNDTTNEHSVSISTDNGLTWSAMVDETFGLTLSAGGPPRLSAFNIDGSRVIACWHLDRVGELVYVTYALPADLIADPTDWIANTTVFNTSRRTHYMGIYHPMGNFNAIGFTAYEAATASNDDNDMVLFSAISTHYSTVKTALGL